MSEKSTPRTYELSTVSTDIKDLQTWLGKSSGRGAGLLQNVMTDEHARALRNDVAVMSGDTAVNERWAMSYRLNEGSQRDVKHLRTIKGLADSLTQLFATDLAQMNTAFSRLENWAPTEFTIDHRALVPEVPVVRKWYESNTPVRQFESNPPRFWGVIAVAIADGSADFHTSSGDAGSWSVQQGDIVVMRGSRLFEDKDNGTFYPSYGFDNISKDGLTAVIYRANDRPAQYDPKFLYENWPEKK